MGDGEGYFLKPWRSGAGDADAAPAEAPVDGGGAEVGDDPLAGFPSRDVSAVVEAQIAALVPNPSWADPNVWQPALTCIAQGFAKCDILDLLAKGSPDDRAPALMATEMAKERTELKALQADYQKRYDEYAASLERADEIRAKSLKEAAAEEAKRQAMRDEVTALENKLWQERWDASKKRSDKSHTDYMASLTNKYWSSS